MKDALLEAGDLAEAVEVQLADERAKVLVLEPMTKHFLAESLLVENFRFLQ